MLVRFTTYRMKNAVFSVNSAVALWRVRHLNSSIVSSMAFYNKGWIMGIDAWLPVLLMSTMISNCLCNDSIKNIVSNKQISRIHVGIVGIEMNNSYPSFGNKFKMGIGCPFSDVFLSVQWSRVWRIESSMNNDSNLPITIPAAIEIVTTWQLTRAKVSTYASCFHPIL